MVIRRIILNTAVSIFKKSPYPGLADFAIALLLSGAYIYYAGLASSVAFCVVTFIAVLVLVYYARRLIKVFMILYRMKRSSDKMMGSAQALLKNIKP